MKDNMPDIQYLQSEQPNIPSRTNQNKRLQRKLKKSRLRFFKLILIFVFVLLAIVLAATFFDGTTLGKKANDLLDSTKNLVQTDTNTPLPATTITIRISEDSIFYNDLKVQEEQLLDLIGNVSEDQVVYLIDDHSKHTTWASVESTLKEAGLTVAAK